MAMLSSGAGFMFLFISLAVAVIVSSLYITRDTHPDAGADGKTWILRQVHVDSGRVRYVTTGTDDLDMARDVADRIKECEPDWANTTLGRDLDMMIK